MSTALMVLTDKYWGWEHRADNIKRDKGFFDLAWLIPKSQYDKMDVQSQAYHYPLYFVFREGEADDMHFTAIEIEKIGKEYDIFLEKEVSGFPIEDTLTLMKNEPITYQSMFKEAPSKAKTYQEIVDWFADPKNKSKIKEGAWEVTDMVVDIEKIITALVEEEERGNKVQEAALDATVKSAESKSPPKISMEAEYEIFRAMAEEHKGKFVVNAGRGFLIKFDNGYGLSVAFGVGNYSSNRNKDENWSDAERMKYYTHPPNQWSARTAEVAIVTPPDDDLLEFDDDYKGDQVEGWLSPSDISTLLTAVETGNEKVMKTTMKAIRRLPKKNAETVGFAAENLEYKFAIVSKYDASILPSTETPEGLETIGKVHVTLVGGKALKPFKAALKENAKEVIEGLPEAPTPVFGDMGTAERTMGDGEVRKTAFLEVDNQEDFHDYVDAMCGALGIENPEPDRWFHVSIANNHGGNPFKSVGDITEADLRGSHSAEYFAFNAEGESIPLYVYDAECGCMMQADTLKFKDWANQEQQSHGDPSFGEWADEEGDEHGDTSFDDWAEHETASHEAHFEVESFSAECEACGKPHLREDDICEDCETCFECCVREGFCAESFSADSRRHGGLPKCEKCNHRYVDRICGACGNILCEMCHGDGEWCKSCQAAAEWKDDECAECGTPMKYKIHTTIEFEGGEGCDTCGVAVCDHCSHDCSRAESKPPEPPTDYSNCDKCGEMNENDFMRICSKCSIWVCEDCSSGGGPDKDFTCGEYGDEQYDRCSDCGPAFMQHGDYTFSAESFIVYGEYKNGQRIKLGQSATARGAKRIMNNKVKAGVLNFEKYETYGFENANNYFVNQDAYTAESLSCSVCGISTPSPKTEMDCHNSCIEIGMAYERASGRCEVCETKDIQGAYDMNHNENDPEWIIVCADCHYYSLYGEPVTDDDFRSAAEGMSSVVCDVGLGAAIGVAGAWLTGWWKV